MNAVFGFGREFEACATFFAVIALVGPCCVFAFTIGMFKLMVDVYGAQSREEGLRLTCISSGGYE